MRSLILAAVFGVFAGIAGTLSLVNSAVVTASVDTDAAAARLQHSLRESPDAIAVDPEPVANCDELHRDVQNSRVENDDLGAAEDDFRGGFGDITNLWASLPSVKDEEDQRRNQLISAGYTHAESEWLLQKEEALLVDAMQAQYAEQPADDTVDYLSARLDARAALRAELGDFDYERYLLATGQGTTIAVSRVVPGSPAREVELRIGDEIINYDGQRVFNMIDLANRTSEPGANDTVILDIVRDGMPMQLELPRGPLGIAGSEPFAF